MTCAHSNRRTWPGSRNGAVIASPHSGSDDNVPTHDVPARRTRDHVIDLLGIGDTYPLTDVTVAPDPPKVTFGGTAKIEIDDAQAGVTYQLCDPTGTPLGEDFTATGSDARAIIITPPVQEDVTYRVRATKQSAGESLPAQAFHFPDATVPVKVGFDADS